MSPALGVIIMMNNYFHDVATALLLAGGYVIWVIVKRYDDSAKTRETTEYFLSVYGKAVKLAKFSLLWMYCRSYMIKRLKSRKPYFIKGSGSRD